MIRLISKVVPNQINSLFESSILSFLQANFFVLKFFSIVVGCCKSNGFSSLIMKFSQHWLLFNFHAFRIIEPETLLSQVGIEWLSIAALIELVRWVTPESPWDWAQSWHWCHQLGVCPLSHSAVGHFWISESFWKILSHVELRVLLNESLILKLVFEL